MTGNLLNGLVYGSLLFVLASGLVLIYGLRRVVNFAHGSLYALGAYIGLSIQHVAGFWVALIVAPLVLAVSGYFLDRLVFRSLQRHPPESTLLVTYGLLLVIQDGIQTIWGKDSYVIRSPDLLSSNLELFGAPFPIYRLSIIALALLVVLGLAMWLRSTRTGLFVRASSHDPVTTQIQGVNVNAVSGVVVAVGCALAGLAGVAAGPLISLSPEMGNQILVDSFVVVVLGGLGSLVGAFIASIALGVLKTFGAIYVPGISSIVPFLVMSIVLMWRPTGFSGKRV